MAIEIADGVVQLSPAPLLNVVAVRGAGGWTLVDAGIDRTGQRLVEQLRGLGIGHGDLERIVLTHGHLDHAGGVARVRDAFGVGEVVVGGGDLPHVRVGANPPGGVPDQLARLPGDLVGYPAVPEAVATDEAVVLGYDRRLVPVPTPGHTPGHTAFHLPEDDLVLGGDTLFNVFSLRPAPGFVCSDAPRNRASIATLAGLGATTLQLAHGSPVTDDAAGRLRELVDG